MVGKQVLVAGCVSASTVAAGAKGCSAGSTRPGHALGENIFSTAAAIMPWLSMVLMPIIDVHEQVLVVS